MRETAWRLLRGTACSRLCPVCPKQRWRRRPVCADASVPLHLSLRKIYRTRGCKLPCSQAVATHQSLSAPLPSLLDFRLLQWPCPAAVVRRPIPFERELFDPPDCVLCGDACSWAAGSHNACLCICSRVASVSPTNCLRQRAVLSEEMRAANQADTPERVCPAGGDSDNVRFHAVSGTPGMGGPVGAKNRVREVSSRAFPDRCAYVLVPQHLTGRLRPARSPQKPLQPLSPRCHCQRADPPDLVAWMCSMDRALRQWPTPRTRLSRQAVCAGLVRVAGTTTHQAAQVSTSQKCSAAPRKDCVPSSRTPSSGPASLRTCRSASSICTTASTCGQ